MTIALTTPCDRAVAATAPVPATRCSQRTGRWTLVATILGSSIAFIDSTVVTVSLPALADRFNASAAAVQWVVVGYTLPLSALVLTGGAFSDRFGARKIFSIGVLLFAIASAFCAGAQSLPQLFVARAAQGAAAALLVPSSLALLGSSFPDAARGRAIGTWSAFASLTAAIGPLLGGWLIDSWSWRVAYLINVPIAAATLVVVAACVPAPAERPRGGRIDVAGAIAITVAFGALTAALTLSSANRGTPRVAAMLGVIGAAAFVLFLMIEGRTDHPMMPLGVWRSSIFASLNALTFVVYAALAMLMFELPIYLIAIRHYTATAAAAAILPMVAAIVALSRATGAWASRAGSRTPLTLGSLLVAAGFALLALRVDVFPGIVTLGLGMAIIVAPLTTAVMTSLDTQHAGLASGVNNAVARMAGLFGVAVLGTITHARTANELAASFHRVMIVAAALAAIGTARGAAAIGIGCSSFNGCGEDGRLRPHLRRSDRLSLAVRPQQRARF
jgi:EmrB/QacA subfamily drug resistance transporter